MQGKLLATLGVLGMPATDARVRFKDSEVACSSQTFIDVAGRPGDEASRSSLHMQRCSFSGSLTVVQRQGNVAVHGDGAAGWDEVNKKFGISISEVDRSLSLLR